MATTGKPGSGSGKETKAQGGAQGTTPSTKDVKPTPAAPDAATPKPEVTPKPDATIAVAAGPAAAARAEKASADKVSADKVSADKASADKVSSGKVSAAAALTVSAGITPPPAGKPQPAAPARTAPPAAAKPAPLPAAEPAPAKASPPAAKPAPLSAEELAPAAEVAAILKADHRDSFGFLGMHIVKPGDRLVVRAFLPGAQAAAVVDRTSRAVVAQLTRIADEGLFAAVIDDRSAPFPYLLRVTDETGAREVEDAYRFPPILSADEEQLFAEGNYLNAYDKLGAHPLRLDGVAGVSFAVWAPNAHRVAVIGDFNGWDGRRHGMRFRHGCGIWEIFIPGVETGALYKYEIKSGSGALLTDKCDPYAFCVERSPGSAAIVCDVGTHAWGDAAWLRARAAADPRMQPMAIYQVHLGSWRRKPEEGHRSLTYREFASELVDYVKDMAFTHVQLLPIGEFDFDASLGYQPFAPFAPTSRWGTPDGLQVLVDRCHQAGIGVIADWVPNHFSDDPHGLRTFDGTHLYEHPDPQRRHHPGSSPLVYDYGRREVSDYLLSNALFWFDKYHLDGLRVGQLANMLYLDYGRPRGEWTPNRFGGHENLDAIDFLRRLNVEVYGRHQGALTIAEDNSGWPRLSHPTFLGGLGFGFKWNLDWVRDTLRYLSRNPVHRKYYHDELVHAVAKAYEENHISPLSHHEVGFGRGSMLRKMTGDRWQRFSSLRALYALMYAEPGKKLLFMGNEFAQEREWNADISLDWHLLDDPLHRGVQALVRDLNTLYRTTPSLYEGDCEAGGFEWIDCNDTDQCVLTFLRQGGLGQGAGAQGEQATAKPETTGTAASGTTVAACHLTPVARRQYRIGVPQPGVYREVLNTDSEKYGGANLGNEGAVTANEEPMHGRPYSISVTLPPLATVIFVHAGSEG